MNTREEQFIKAVRDYGNWSDACEHSGMTIDEVESLCQSDKDFDLAQVEAQLAKIEENMNNATYLAIEKARQLCADNMDKLRKQAMDKYKARHSDA